MSLWTDIWSDLFIRCNIIIITFDRFCWSWSFPRAWLPWHSVHHSLPPVPKCNNIRGKWTSRFLAIGQPWPQYNWLQNLGQLLTFCYRTTPCISAVFAVARCLSVCLSIEMAEDIVKLLCRPGSPIILVFDPLPPAPVPNSKGNPFSGGAKYKGGEKILRFSTEIFIYLGNGTRQTHACYETLITSHMRSIEWRHFQWPWRATNPVLNVTASLEVEYIDYILGTKLLQNNNRKLYPVYQMVQLSMTLIVSWLGFQGRDIFRHWGPVAPTPLNF